MLERIAKFYKNNKLLTIWLALGLAGLLIYFILKSYYNDGFILSIFLELFILIHAITLAIYSIFSREDNTVFITTIIALASFTNFSNLSLAGMISSIPAKIILPLLFVIILIKYFKNKQNAGDTTLITIITIIYFLVWILYVPYQWFE